MSNVPNPIPRKTNFSDLNCQGKYKFRCNWVRPGRLMNQQPIAGQVLPYAYMNEMGSSLTKNRVESNILQNATAHRKNTVVFLSRPTGKNCGKINPCGNKGLCKLCTGNKNPNFINRY